MKIRIARYKCFEINYWDKFNFIYLDMLDSEFVSSFDHIKIFKIHNLKLDSTQYFLLCFRASEGCVHLKILLWDRRRRILPKLTHFSLFKILLQLIISSIKFNKSTQ